MATKDNRIVLITGASSGIGRAVAEALAKEGYRVYGTSRKPSVAPDEDLMKGSFAPGFFKLIPLDVCDNASVETAVQTVLQVEGRIDILINSAGFAAAGAIEETTPEEAFSQMNTNFFGTFRMCRQVLPTMRQQKSGLIINIGSVVGLISLPFHSMYSISKCTLEFLTESLRMEVAPFGIRAVIVEPGDIKSGFTGARHIALAARESSYPRSNHSIQKMSDDEQKGPGPELVARTILRLVKKKNPPIRVVVGPIYKVFYLIKKFFPARFTEYIVKSMY